MALTRINGNLISSGTITGNLFLSNTITGNLIAPAAVTGDKIGLTAITGNLVAAAAITGDKIGLTAITSNLIAANAVTTAAIADGSINTSELATRAVTGDKIGLTAITSNLIASGVTLTSPVISSANLTTALTLNGAAGTNGQVLTSAGSGLPTWATAAGGSLRFISAVTATAASEVEFLSGISSTYDTYVFEITNVYRTADATTELRMQLYSAGAYVAGTSYLTHTIVSDLGTSGYGTALSYSNQSTGRLTNTASIPYTAGNANAYNAVATLTGVNSGRANFRTFALSNGDNTKIDSSTNIYAQTITGIKFFLAAGTINCTIRMYGISKT